MNKIVAVKLLAHAHSGKKEITRFHQEMLASGAIEHPHIVQATDAGEADGRPYLVMEYIHGVDFATILKTCGPLKIADACEVVRQAALGIQAAHERGVIHRDIKPANLMLCGKNKQSSDSSAFSTPMVKVLDLGLASLKQTSTDDTGLTELGQVMGTIDYMAPEQISDTREAEFQADVYALGATLWKLLIGKAPGEQEGTHSPITKAMHRLNKPLPSISSLGVELPEELTAFINSLLETDPNARPESAAQVAESLAQFSVGHQLGELLLNAEHSQTEEEVAARMETVILGEANTVPASSALQPLVAPARSPSPPAEKSRNSLGWVLTAVAGAGVLLLWAIMYILQLEDGTTIRVEINDPSIEVTLKEQNIVIRYDDEPVTVAPGRHTLHVQRGPLSFNTETFELKDGETLLVKVERVNGKVQVVRNGKVIESRPLETPSRETVPMPVVESQPTEGYQLTPEQKQFVEETRKLPMAEQIEAVEAKFEEINPAMRNPLYGDPVHAKENPKTNFEFQNGVPFSCKLTNWRISRLWPLVVFSSLTSLDISEASITDVRPLQLLPKLIYLKHNIAVANVETENQLKAMATLRVINNQSPEAFFARRVSIRNEIQELKETFTSLPLTEARQQVAGLLKKLNPGWEIETQRLCDFDGDVYHLKMGLVDQTRDLSPLGALPLNELYLGNGRAYDFSFLRGMPLSQLTLEKMPLLDLSPLQGLPLEQLHVRGCGVSDLTPLTGMPLQDLSLGDNVVSDLTPLRGMPLTRLELTDNPVSDLTPLEKMPLTSLFCLRTLVTDISPLRGMPLKELLIYNYKNGTNFKENGSRVADLSPVKGMPLKRFATNFRTYYQPDIELVKSLPLEILGYTHGMDPSVEAYWERFEAARAAEAMLVERLLELPAAERVEAVIQEMNKTLPSKKPYRIQAVFQDGKVTEMTYHPYQREESSLYLLQAFPHLRKLKLKLLGSMTREIDLSPIMQLRIEELEIDHQELERDYLVDYNLPVLRDMQHLKKLNGKPAAEVLGL